MNAVPSIQRLLIRDLETLRRELWTYTNQSDIWDTRPGTSYSAGTLTLHLTGNISHFIGTVICGNGYVRDREVEFTDGNIGLVELERRIDVAIQSVEDGLSQISDLDLEKPYPILLSEVQLTIGQFLTHLVSHFGYHLGQIDYHRRIVSGSNTTVGAESISELHG